jgi:hypothetical protein
MLRLSWPGSQIKENNHENRKSHLISSQILQLTSRKVPKKKQSPMLLVASSSFPKNMFRELRRQKLSHPLFLKETLSSLQHYKSVKYRRQLKLPLTSYRKTQKTENPPNLASSPTDCRPDFLRRGEIYCTMEAARLGVRRRSGVKFFRVQMVMWSRTSLFLVVARGEG